MKLVFLPAILLMDRISYSTKFILVIALFAVPMSVTSIQNIVSDQAIIDADKSRLVGIELLRKVDILTPSLENVRDLSLVRRGHIDKEVRDAYQKAKDKALGKLALLDRDVRLTENKLYSLALNGIENRLVHSRASTGSEGDMLNTIFESSMMLVNDAYELNGIIANSFGVSSETDPMIQMLLNLLTVELRAVTEEVGRSRAYGAYYLQSKFMNSSDIEFIEKNYHSLGVLENRLREKLKLLFITNAKTQYQDVIDLRSLAGISSVRHSVEDSLVLDVDFTTQWQDYYADLSSHIETTSSLKADLFRFITTLYEKRIVEKERLLKYRGIGFGALVLISAYLFVGFYLSSKRSIGSLVSAAHSVAEGNLDAPVEVSTKDEMLELADMMDSMRIQLKERQQELVLMTITDGLTQIRNRKYFNEELSRCMNNQRRSASPVSLLLIDVDHFKKLNDNFGHQAGDVCLQRLAKTIESQLLRKEDSVSRYGGEEFAVLLPSTREQGASEAASRISDAIKKLSIDDGNGNRLSFTVSIGIASSTNIDTGDKLIRAADEALYEAKSRGRDRWAVSEV